MIPANILNGFHVCHTSTHMNRHNTAGCGCEGLTNGDRIQSQRIIYICENRYCTHTKHSFKTGYKSEGRHDHFVALAYSKCCQRGSQRRCSTRSELYKTAVKTVAYSLLQLTGFPYI